MRKAHRNRPLTEAQTKRNRYLSKTRYVWNKALVRCTVNSAMRGQPISGCSKGILQRSLMVKKHLEKFMKQ